MDPWFDNGAVHQFLVERGYSVSLTDLECGAYGRSTRGAVEAYQRDHDLQVDGVVGPLTWASLRAPSTRGDVPRGWLCRPSEARDAVREVVRAAVGEVGVRENPPGSNRGPRAYMPGHAWCAEFASWAYQRSAPPSPFGRMAATWDLYEWGRRRGYLVGATDPVLAGDLGLVLRGDGVRVRRGHVALVAHVLPDERLATVEGNSGDRVAARLRMRVAFSAVVRPVPL